MLSRSLRRGQPFGSLQCQAAMAALLGFVSALRPPGRLYWRTSSAAPVPALPVLLGQMLPRNSRDMCPPHLTGKPFSAAAYCLARARLPLEVFRRLVRSVADSLLPATGDTGRWLGH